jgi:hypothetical protein
MKATIVFCCVILGVVPQLLLNGQVFTNALVALPFLTTAAVVSAATFLDRRTPGRRRWAWGFATVLTALLVAVTLLSLPSAYRFQEEFNQVLPRLRARAAELDWERRERELRNLLICPTHGPPTVYSWMVGVPWPTPVPQPCYN